MDTVDAAFRIHEGRNIQGELKWSKRASAGTTKSREAPIILNNSYELNWRDYSGFEEVRNGQFRYLLLRAAERSK